MARAVAARGPLRFCGPAEGGTAAALGGGDGGSHSRSACRPPCGLLHTPRVRSDGTGACDDCPRGHYADYLALSAAMTEQAMVVGKMAVANSVAWGGVNPAAALATGWNQAAAGCCFRCAMRHIGLVAHIL